MLYDPKWEKQAEQKNEIGSLGSIIAWLETKNQSEKYEFMDCNGKCLFGQYMTHHGIPWDLVKYRKFSFKPIDGKPHWQLHHIASWPEDRTFGGALKRAKLFAAGDQPH